jgi:hypothetical protein
MCGLMTIATRPWEFDQFATTTPVMCVMISRIAQKRFKEGQQKDRCCAANARQ